MNPFEYDPKKSEANKSKHGIDFEEAKRVWLDIDRLEISARTIGESRFALIGRIEKKVWTVIFTKRGATLRIISARRARHKEMRLYEGEQEN